MDTTQQSRFEELKAKAAGPGLSDEESTELGKLYALEENADYSNAATAGNAEQLEEEAKQQVILDQEIADAQRKASNQKRSRISFKEGGV